MWAATEHRIGEECEFAPQMNIIVKTAKAGDVEAIACLHRSCFATTYPTFQKLHTQDEDTEHFAEILRENEMYVAEIDGQLVGYCAFGNGWLNDLYVAQAHQFRGIGTRFLQKIKQSNNEIQLWTFQINLNAHRFYERNGFSAVEETDGSGNEQRQPDVRYLWRRGI